MAEKIVGNFQLTIGRVGTPGAPIFTFSGKADEQGNIGPGEGKITQSVKPPGGVKPVHIKSGHIRQTGLQPHDEILLSLEGSYAPEADQPLEAPFQAATVFEQPKTPGKELTGKGEFTDNPKPIKDVPAKLEVGG